MNGHSISSVALRAPISGTITQRHVNAGAGVQAGASLFSIADLSTVWVIANVPESQLNMLRVGTPAEVRSAALGQTIAKGRVTYIDPVLNEETRTGRVRLEVVNPNQQLKIGTFVEVGFTGAAPSTLPVATELVVPAEAVQTVEGKTVVFVPGPKPGQFVSRDVDLNDQPIGPGGNATLIGNTLTNNGTGILIGTTFPDDTSKVTANFNNIFGNTIGVDATKSATDPNSGVDARFNWWGDFSGPQRDDGQGSGGSPPNPGGQGNEAEGNVFIEDPRPVPTPVLVATSKDDYLAQTTGITTVPVTIAPNPLPSQPVTDGSAEFNVTFGSPLQNVTTDEEFTFTANDVIATYNGAAVPVGQIAVVLDGSRTKASVTVSGLTGRGVLDVSVITGAALSESGFLTLSSGTASALIGAPNQQPVILPNPPAEPATRPAVHAVHPFGVAS